MILSKLRDGVDVGDRAEADRIFYIECLSLTDPLAS